MFQYLNTTNCSLNNDTKHLSPNTTNICEIIYIYIYISIFITQLTLLSIFNENI